MKLAYVILYVPRVRDAVEFYERAFGLKCRLVHESGAYAEPHSYSGNGMRGC
jgi:catechol 2,3-dioxygenase-like lactoylglutathione lyase family enzyme